MKIKKLVLSALVVMLFVFIGTAFAQDVPILYEGVDSYTGGRPAGWDKISGSACSSVNFGDSHGSCMAIKTPEGSTLSARYRFDKAYTGGDIYYIAFMRDAIRWTVLLF